MATIREKFNQVNTKFGQVITELLTKLDKGGDKQLTSDDFVENSTHLNLRAGATQKADVGLEDVQNYGIATEGEAESVNTSNKYLTPQRTQNHFLSRVSFGIVPPDNNDGKPNGSIYFNLELNGSFIKADGEYFPATLVYKKINGIWRISIPFFKLNDLWHRAFTVFPNASGGSTFTEVIGSFVYRYHRFTSTGSHTFIVHEGGEMDVLVVAGGGGAGAGLPGNDGFWGGGGGAGGVIHRHGITINNNTSITIGNGGQRSGSWWGAGSSGGNSTFGNLIALGGGYGGTSGNSEFRPGCDGGSGGGGGYGYNNAADGGNALQPQQSGESGFYGHGHNGGSDRYGGGGGGAGGHASGSTGGSGLIIWGNTYGKGGNGATGGAGAANTGNGGGGNEGYGGNGGSGVVIVRYPISFV